MKAYCNVCNKFQVVEVEDIEHSYLDGFPRGDIVCRVCYNVIAILKHEKEGILQFIEWSEK